MNATATLEQSANLILLVEKKSKRMYYCMQKLIGNGQKYRPHPKKISICILDN
jgi:hypothetical protein